MPARSLRVSGQNGGTGDGGAVEYKTTATSLPNHGLGAFRPMPYWDSTVGTMSYPLTPVAQRGHYQPIVGMLGGSIGLASMSATFSSYESWPMASGLFLKTRAHPDPDQMVFIDADDEQHAPAADDQDEALEEGSTNP